MIESDYDVLEIRGEVYISHDDFLRFPLGHLDSKTATRELARKYNLSVADKPDSQDICFVTSDSYRDLINKIQPDINKEGNIFDIHGGKIGTHKGIANYTVGQRKGVGVGGQEKPLYVQEGLGIEKYDAEGRVLLTEHEGFLLYNIYFPNGQKDDVRLKYKLDFYDDLLPIINDQVESGNNVIVAGDWNTAHYPIDLARPKENIKTSGFMPIEREKLDEYVNDGWVDTFRLFHDEPDRYSWWSYRMGARARNVGWRIDYFFVNSELSDLCNNADIHQDVMGSDHCPVSLSLDL